MSEVEFVTEVPPRTGGKGRGTPEWVTTLQANPGQWAKLPIKGSRKKENGLEFVTRTIDGEKVVFGRYVGNGA